MTHYSYQLYSSRNFGPMSDTLAMIANLGYSRVEGYGALYANLKNLDGLKDRPREEQPAHEERALQPRHGRDRPEDGAGHRAHAEDHRHLRPAPGRARPSDQRRRLARLRASAGRRRQADRGCRPSLRLAQPRFRIHRPRRRQLSDRGRSSTAGRTCRSSSTWPGPCAAIRTRFPGSSAMPTGSPPPTSRISHPRARMPTRMAGPMSAPARWTGAGSCWRSRTSALDLFVAEHDNPSDDARFARRSIEFLKSL